MKYLQVHSFVLGFLLIIFFFLIPSSAFAAISITSSPGSAALEEEFTVSFIGTGLENGIQYYAKARIGKDGSYNKGETKNNNTWFGDSSSFENFPVFTADSNGNINGSLLARAKSTASLGENSLFVRLRKVGTSTNSDSSPFAIVLTSTLTPTPTPTPFQNVQTIELEAGQNLIALAVDKGTSYTAQNLLDELGSLVFSLVQKMNPGGSYERYPGGNNFTIEPGKGYFVKTDRPGQRTLLGTKLAQASISINSGQSLISFTNISENISTAEKLLQEMKKQGIGIDKISRWIYGAWETHLINFSPNNFPIEVGRGYLVRNSGTSQVFAIPASGVLECTVCRADVNRDSKVSLGDFNLVKLCLGKKATDTNNAGSSCASPDINNDGNIDLVDFNCLKDQIGKFCR